MANRTSRVHLFNVPFDNSDTDVYYLGSKDNFLSFLNGRLNHSFDNLQYQRNNDILEIYLPCHVDSLYDSNYASIHNPTYDRDFFYFIQSRSYISDVSCKLVLVEDDFNNWFYQCSVHTCLVEREHVLSDGVGEHTLDENLPMGEFIFEQLACTTGLESTSYLVVSKYSIDGELSPGKCICGTPVVGSCYASSSFSGISETIKTICSNKSDAVVGASIVPTISLGDFEEGGLVSPSNSPVYKTLSVSLSNDLNGYIPKNNKLLCYPYRSLYVNNSNGSSQDLIIEHFSGGTNFGMQVSGGLCPQAELYPRNYKGTMYNRVFSLTINFNSPIPYNVSTFNTYVQNSAMSQVVRGATNIATGNIGGILGQATEYYEHMRNPAQNVNGNVTLSTISGTNKFWFYQKTITSNYARAIDNFFEQYGYKVMALKVPNINTRPNWNYVKTSGSCITGVVPHHVLERFNNMFKNGVTLWHGAYKDYSGNNH